MRDYKFERWIKQVRRWLKCLGWTRHAQLSLDVTAWREDYYDNGLTPECAIIQEHKES